MRVLFLPQLGRAWGKAGVIAVMCTDNLNLIDAQLISMLGARWQGIQYAEEREGKQRGLAGNHQNS
jgi:hypothetical protein